MNPSRRFACTVMVLATTAITLQIVGNGVPIPPHLPLREFPYQVGPWRGTDVPLGKDILDVLGPGDFVSRDYRTEETKPPVVAEVFIAYYPGQQTGDVIHSPQNCLPGSGWTPIQFERITLTIPGDSPFAANRYVVAKGASRQLVLYWYWAHGRRIASEYLVKYYLVRDSIRLHRSDGAMIRISIPMLPEESASAAEQRALPFAASLVPILPNYIPR